MILIGQRAFWESDSVFSLDGLDLAQIRTFLDARQIPHTEDEASALLRFTGGNPRLTELCIALYQTSPGESFGDVLAQVPNSHALLPLWLRLERRLPVAERQLLQRLSVFRSPAPIDAWRNADVETVDVETADVETADVETADALAQLIQRRLVQEDGLGGVSMLPALSEIVFAELPAETQEDLHLYAAHIREERGEYTAAAYHLHQAGQLEDAISLWYNHREDEIHRGQAATALALFEQISLRRLSRTRQKELRLLRAELYQLTGAPAQVIESLVDVDWDTHDEAQVDASLLLGRAYDRQGRSDQAQRGYAQGLAAAEKLMARTVELHVQRGLVYLHERDMQEAWLEVQKARYLAENMTGTLHEQSGRLDDALAHYESALAIAQEINYLAGVARSFHNLGNVYSRQRRLDQAVTYYTQSMTTHETMGNRVGLEVARSGIVANYMQAGRYAEAVDAAARALTFFQSVGDSFWIAVNASNLAEAHIELGHIEEAEHYAQLVLDEEAPHSHPYALFTLARVRHAQARTEDARFIFDQARRLAEMNDDRYLLAYCWEEIGKLQRAADDPNAGASLQQAIDLFQALKIHAKVAEISTLAQKDDV
ncbi:MAG: tetratricopeptide repeat protein [Caldilineaceae bacterium]